MNSNPKCTAIRAIKRMSDVLNEQLSEVGYKDEDLTEAIKQAKLLSRVLANYLEEGA